MNRLSPVCLSLSPPCSFQSDLRQMDTFLPVRADALEAAAVEFRINELNNGQQRSLAVTPATHSVRQFGFQFSRIRSEAISNKRRQLLTSCCCKSAQNNGFESWRSESLSKRLTIDRTRRIQFQLQLSVPTPSFEPDLQLDSA